MKRLLIRPGAMGDTVVWLPAAEHLLSDGGAILCPGSNTGLVRHLAGARPIEGSGLDLLELPGANVPGRFLEWIRSFEEVVSWYGSAREEFRSALGRLGVKAAFHPALPQEGGGVHAVDYYLRQAGAPEGGVPSVPAKRTSGGYAVIHPFSGSRSKNWPLDRFRAVAERVSKHMEVRWCAGPEEKLDGAWRFDTAAGLAGFLAGAAVYLGNDSGPSHLAAAVGTPVVAMFGPSDSRVWAPRGESVRVFGFDATPERVAEAVITSGSPRQ